eukprot:m51a1_g13391 hypothetical protein (104) ;mRNA; f:50-361
MSAGSVVAGMVERLDKLSALCPEPPESSNPDPDPADDAPADVDSDGDSGDTSDEGDEGGEATIIGQPIPQTTGSAEQAGTSGLTPSMLSLALPSPHCSTTGPR